MEYLRKYELWDTNTYNPDKATYIGSYNNGEMPDSFGYYEETLYKNEEDEFFIVNSTVDSDEGDLILLPDEEELLAWAENHLDVDLYIKYFGAVSE